MTGFHDVRFPTDIAYGATGGPQYLTEITALSNGSEKRAEYWAQPLSRYNVAHGVKNAMQLEVLIAFFRARAGRAYGFRFKDWTDYQVTGQIIGVGDGGETDFQLVKTYSSGNTSIARTLTRPVASTLNVYIDSVLQVGGYTLDDATGIVTFSSAPDNAAVISVDSEFDIPARFDTDALNVTIDTYNSYSWLDIPLVELRAG